MAVSGILLDYKKTKNGHFPSLVFVTGKRLHSNPEKGPMLQTGVREFPALHNGPVTTDVVGNKGRFEIRDIALEEWLLSAEFSHFEEAMTLALSVNA